MALTRLSGNHQSSQGYSWLLTNRVPAIKYSVGEPWETPPRVGKTRVTEEELGGSGNPIRDSSPVRATQSHRRSDTGELEETLRPAAPTWRNLHRPCPEENRIVK